MLEKVCFIDMSFYCKGFLFSSKEKTESGDTLLNKWVVLFSCL